MELIRLVPRKLFEPHLNRFNSGCFREDDGGISVVDLQCIEGKGHTIYEHVGKYYRSFADPEPIFLRFFDTDLPSQDGLKVQQSTSESGDDCHHDIVGMTNKEQRNFWRRHAPDIESLEICLADGKIRQLNLDDLVH